MTRDDITARITNILTRRPFTDASKIKPHSDLVSDLGLDSLDIVDLSMDLEDEFDIEIPDDEVERLKTVGAAVDYLAGRLGVAEVAAA